MSFLYDLDRRSERLFMAKAKERDNIDKILRGDINSFINRDADKTYRVLERPAMWKVANKFTGKAMARRNKEAINIKQFTICLPNAKS